MIDQDKLSIGIIAVLVLNGLVLVWLVDQMGRLRGGLKHPGKHTPPLSPTEKMRLEQDLQLKAETEVKVITSKLSTAMDNFSKELQASLTTQASSGLKQQLAQPEKLIGEFTATMATILEGLTTALHDTGKTAQSQLLAGVAEQKQIMVDSFQQNVATVVNNYLIAALGESSVDSDQTAQVLRQLETHKDELKKDLLHEA
jgi:hypothetical protein